ncbi:TPA: hypothetical protein ENS27_01085 [bacterium]|nr:hypothetical protein [bacterium]
MEGNPDDNYKTIQSFLDNNDTRENLHRLFNEDSQFVIGDPTEIHRLQAKKTKYVGKVGKGKKLGFWLLTLASPYKGRAIPFNFITYSSKTINDEFSLRNLEHLKVIAELKELLGDKIKDMKNLLNIEKIMNQKRENMEKMLSMVLLSYSIGETIREKVYPEKKQKLYSVLHILLKRKVSIIGETLREVIDSAFLVFSNIVLRNVRTYV